MTREAFEALANEAFRAIPRRFRSRMRNVAIVVEDEPDAELLREMEVEPPGTLLASTRECRSPSAGGTTVTVCPIGS